MNRARLVLALVSLAWTHSLHAQCPGWSTAFDGSGTGAGVNSEVWALTTFNSGTGDRLIAGGDLTQCGALAVNRIASWDGASWQPLASGLQSNVGGSFCGALASVAPNSFHGAQLYAGGIFDRSGATNMRNVARWDGAAWSPLVDTTTGVDGVGIHGNIVWAIAIDDSGSSPRVYVGGGFAAAGGSTAANVAVFDGAHWSALGSGLPAVVNDLLLFNDGAGHWLFAATDAGVYGWDGSSWSLIDNHLTGLAVDLDVFDLDGPGPAPARMIVGGRFALSNGARNVAQLSGGSWLPTGSALGSALGGSNDVVYSFLVHDDCGVPTLLAGGHFDLPGGVSYESLARWNGSSWQAAQNSPGALILVQCDFDGPLPGVEHYAGGYFSELGEHPASCLSAACSCGAARFPLVTGESVVTGDGYLGDQYVVTVIDTRQPRGALDSNWSAPKFHNEIAPSAPTETWTLANLGQVFGVCLDKANPPNIYVAATSVYDHDVFGPAGPGGVYKLDGATGDISIFTQTYFGAFIPPNTLLPGPNFIPNTGPGLGDICYDAYYHYFYVSNFEDGKIYVLDSNGAVLQAWDPFQPDDQLPGYAPLGERIWAVQKPDSRSLLFSVWLEDYQHQAVSFPVPWPTSLGTTPNNAIFLANATGGLLSGAPLIRKIMPSYASNWSNPVSDIALGPDNKRVLLAERSMFDDTTPGAHNARVLEWNNRPWYVGWWYSNTNSTGGADFDCASEVLATGDALRTLPGESGNSVYGVQIIPAIGNGPGAASTANSWLIDLNDVLGPGDKTRTGDIEVVRNCHRRGSQVPGPLVQGPIDPLP